MTDSTHDFLDSLAKILLRCWIFGLYFRILCLALHIEQK